MSATDAELVCSAVRGDRDALGELLSRHGPAVESGLHIAGAWRDSLDTGDVMQVTYLEAFLQISRFDSTRADSFGGWLRRIAENNLRDAIRALEAQKSLPPDRRMAAHGEGDSYVGLFDLLATTMTTPTRAVRRDEATDLVRAALGRLPPDYAAVVRLYDLEGRPIADVARALGRGQGAVHMLRVRAHDRLRDLMGAESRILDSM
jgi:RNA polymerase sigma-70 factor (ECF subfamily)